MPIFTPVHESWNAEANRHEQIAQSFVGKVLSEYERNGYNDSDFYAVVWDDENQEIRDIEWGTTRFACIGYGYGCAVDATEETRAKANEYARKNALSTALWEDRLDAREVKRGRDVKVIGGRKYKGLAGDVFWMGPERTGQRFWLSNRQDGQRIGVRALDGSRFFIDAKHLEVINPEQFETPVAQIEARFAHYVKY